MGHDRGNRISHDEYAKGFTLFAFDLTPDLDEGAHFHLVKQGNIKLGLHFATQLPETINVIVYAEFDVIEVDKARNILFEYSAWIVTSWHLYWSRIVIRLYCSVGSLRSTAFHPSERVYMSSMRLPIITLDYIGQLCLQKTKWLSILTVMENFHLRYIAGARKNDGWAIPSPCRVNLHQCVVSIVYIICFTVLRGRYDHLAHGFRSWLCGRSLRLGEFNNGRHWKCHFSTGTLSLIWSEHPKDSLDSLVLLLATWQRRVKVVRFRYLGGCIMIDHSFEDGAPKRQQAPCVWSLGVGVPLGNVFFFHNHLRDVHGIPMKIWREPLWVRWMLETYYYNACKRPTLEEVEIVAKFLDIKNKTLYWLQNCRIKIICHANTYQKLL